MMTRPPSQRASVTCRHGHRLPSHTEAPTKRDASRSVLALVVVGALASLGQAQGHALRYRAWPEQDLTGYQIASYYLIPLADANGDGITDVIDRGLPAVLLATGRGTLERLPGELADGRFLGA